jgi:hypothetical protein
LVAALWLAGCADQPGPAAPPSRPATPAAPVSPLPTVAPLPPADALTGVLYQLADTSIPADRKVALVEYATVDDEPELINFGEALKASGFDPLTVDAADLAWAGEPGHVAANVTIGTPNPAVKPFAFPMEFNQLHDAWQLSRRTADQLLPLVSSPEPMR